MEQRTSLGASDERPRVTLCGAVTVAISAATLATRVQEEARDGSAGGWGTILGQKFGGKTFRKLDIVGMRILKLSGHGCEITAGDIHEVTR